MILSAILERFLQPLLLGGVVVCVGVIAHQAWSLHTVRAERAEAVAEVARLKEALRLAELKAKALEAEAAEEKRRLEIKYATDMARIRADLDRTLRLLHDERERASLRPATDAPTPCRDYAAAPTQLSVPDAEFLVREAYRADRIVMQLDAALDYIERVCRPGEVKSDTLNEVE